ncbi:hypothetical protein BCV69DRAFT_121715 [Microstroma glucosiphilum]|uniref:Uncharacterized protein n=1 Tax=Pseudomicrostroma glucosiphilum TaxID=1684307 RepID=A0A316TYI5_9BASI|nr:hypothetical protein BCV69DRAFT_121715 [Pseudomicrostroma glucosiphilum]PWN17774.1 hypothetical protein BCV69DRAFT_121715 [Pseudomicrostroma glucosiphilum]
MSASSALGRTLPALKLTAHDPRLVQVFTTPHSHLSRGDFGFKSPLDSAINAARHHRDGAVRYIQVKEQDSVAGHGLNWKEREGEVLLLKRWSETHASVRREEPNTSYLRSTASDKGRKSQPLPHSRFDRTSRRNLPTRNAATNVAEEGPDSLRPIPNYLVYSEERFEQLLELIRNNREAYKEARLLERALDQRSAKFIAAQRRYETLLAESEHASAAGGQTPLPVPPKEEDYSVEAELEALRTAKPTGEVDEVELDASDMHNLARSTHNYFLAKYVEGLFSNLKLDDPDSKVMPRYVTASASASKAAEAYGPRRLHQLGGLQYSQPDEIISHALSPALPGRILAVEEAPYRRQSSGTSITKNKYSLSVGSRVALIRSSRAGNLQLTGFDRTRARPEQGAGLFRFDSAAKLKLTNPTLDVLAKQRRFGAGAEGAWTPDMQQLGLGYITADMRGAAQRNSSALNERTNQVGEQTARAETIPGSRGWVGRSEDSLDWSASRMRVSNPISSRYRERFGWNEDHFGGAGGVAQAGRAGPGGSFSRVSGPGGAARADGKVRLNRDGYRRAGLGLGLGAGNARGGQGDGAAGERGSGQVEEQQQQQRGRENISDLIYGRKEEK